MIKRFEVCRSDAVPYTGVYSGFLLLTWYGSDFRCVNAVHMKICARNHRMLEMQDTFGKGLFGLFTEKGGITGGELMSGDGV